MFLKKYKKWSKQISVKITMVFLLIFVFGSGLLFLLFYFIYSQTLASKDYEILNSKAQSYIAIYKNGGTKSLQNILSSSQTTSEDIPLYVRIENKKHKTTLYFAPNVPDKNHQIELEKLLISRDQKSKLSYITLKESDKEYEFLSIPISSNEIIQVGRNIDDRDEFLDVFEETFLGFIISSILIGGLGGIFFSNRMLKPVRQLINTVKNISLGDDNARVALSNTKDEFETLTTLFNKMLDHVQSSNRAIRETLDSIAHQLRTPLTSVRAEAEVTLRKNPSVEEYRYNIQNSIEGIDQVLEEFNLMMDITEIESGLNNLKKEKVNLNYLCLDVIELYEIIAEEKQIELIFKSESVPLISADKTRLRQAIANLLDNAIKYSGDKTCIIIETGNIPHFTYIKIIDQGIGISQAEIGNIWKRLYRGDRSRNQRGIGLGLSLAKSIIEAHKGKISAESSGDNGSTFTISLPYKF